MPTVTPTILSGGKAMDPTYELSSIHVWTEVNRIPRAELRVLDGDAAQRRFAVSDTSFFVPGANIEIRLRYEGESEHSVFEGIVVRHGVEASERGSILVIGLKDAAVKLTGARQSAVFRSKTDASIIQELIEAAGVGIGSVERTRPVHVEMVQYRCTAWDFILSRADAQGLLVTVDHGRVSLRRMVVGDAPKHSFEWGISEIYDVDIEIDADHQYASVEAVGWNPKTLAPTTPSKARNAPSTAGNLDGAKLAKAVGRERCTLSHLVPAASEELQAWADSTLDRSRLAMLRGRITTPGFADIQLLDTMELAGIGKRFNGKTLVTGVHHQVDANGWQTDVQFGLSPEPFSRAPHVLETPAGGLLPAVRALQLGVVAAFEEDPEQRLRVKVNLPSVDASGGGAVWAQLVCPDAGLGRGYCFWPEPGDEVIIGFLDADPRCAVILGSLYGAKNLPPTAFGTPTAANEHKGIVSKRGTIIGFVDGDGPSVFIETPRKNRLLLDDQGESVALSDQHGNSITLGRDGIVLKSIKALRIDAATDVEIQGSTVDIL